MKFNEENLKIKNSSELLKLEEVNNTPFTIARIQKGENDNPTYEYWVLLGNYHFNKEAFSDPSEAEKYARELNWEKVMKVLTIMFNEFEKEISKNK